MPATEATCLATTSRHKKRTRGEQGSGVEDMIHLQQGVQ
jgi:hypothetical protein